jgi:hypothetical protein
LVVKLVCGVWLSKLLSVVRVVGRTVRACRVVDAAHTLQTFEVLHGVGTAELEGVASAVIKAGGHAGAVGGGVAWRLHALGFPVVACDHRDGLLRVGLGGGCRAFGTKPVTGLGAVSLAPPFFTVMAGRVCVTAGGAMNQRCEGELRYQFGSFWR